MLSISRPAKARVLCVEDDDELARMLADVLIEGGFAPDLVGSAREMDMALARGGADLVVLDVMLPGEDGLSICRRLRATSTLPILMLTARGEDLDRIVGLEIGADDYVTKPFNPRELIARIRALLRRTGSGAPRMRTRSLAFAGWRIDPATRELHDPGGIRVVLTSVEFELLLAFCRHPGQVLSREQLIDLVHGGQAGSVERSIDVHVSRIRQKIEIDPRDPALIKTVRLGGYMLAQPVELS
ncbi:MAG: response regulator transcription factor [Pseudomonadota bacterium]